jgi:hypothetical protein
VANKYFNAVLDQMRSIHDRKVADYASTQNPYSNFEMSAEVAGVPVETVFRVLIGVKLARLAELLNNAKTPNNESIDDSIIDLANYAALWASYRNRVYDHNRAQFVPNSPTTASDFVEWFDQEADCRGSINRSVTSKFVAPGENPF